MSFLQKKCQHATLKTKMRHKSNNFLNHQHCFSYQQIPLQTSYICNSIANQDKQSLVTTHVLFFVPNFICHKSNANVTSLTFNKDLVQLYLSTNIGFQDLIYATAQQNKTNWSIYTTHTLLFVPNFLCHKSNRKVTSLTILLITSIASTI